MYDFLGRPFLPFLSGQSKGSVQASWRISKACSGEAPEGAKMVSTLRVPRRRRGYTQIPSPRIPIEQSISCAQVEQGLRYFVFGVVSNRPERPWQISRHGSRFREQRNSTKTIVRSANRDANGEIARLTSRSPAAVSIEWLIITIPFSMIVAKVKLELRYSRKRRYCIKTLLVNRCAA